MTDKLKAIFAYHNAIEDGQLEVARVILKLLIKKCRRFRNNDTDWMAERYLNKHGVHESYTDRLGCYSMYHIC